MLPFNPSKDDKFRDMNHCNRTNDVDVSSHGPGSAVNTMDALSDRVYDSYDYDDAYQDEGVSRPVAIPVINPLDQDEPDEEDYLSLNQAAQTELGVMVEQCEVLADDYLAALGLPPCAKKWATKGAMTKEEKDEVYRRLIELRDTGDPDLVKLTGDCAFMLNHKLALSLAWDIYKRSGRRGSPVDRVMTTFDEYWAYNTTQWLRFDPKRGAFTNYLTQGVHKVKHNSTDMRIQLDPNRQYHYNQLREAEAKYMRDVETTEGVADDLTLHKMTHLSMSTIAGYRAWQNASNPVEFDYNIQTPKVNKASDNRHTMQPDEAAVDSEMKNLVRDRIKALLPSLSPEKYEMICMKLGITDYGMMKNKAISEIMGCSVREINQVMARAMHRLRNDPVCRSWFGVRTENTKSIMRQETEKTADDYMQESDEQEVSQFDVENALHDMLGGMDEN